MAASHAADDGGNAEGVRMSENLDFKNLVVVCVRGGVVCDVQAPEGITVEVRDYDVVQTVTEDDEHMRQDEDGDWYCYGEWLNDGTNG